MNGYKGNFPYGKNGISYRFSGNMSYRFGQPDLITFQDIMTNDKNRRKTNPISGLKTEFNIYQVGWVNETSILPKSRLPSAENLKRDEKSQPRLNIYDKEHFDLLLNNNIFISNNIPKYYYSMKYPYDKQLTYPFLTQSSILKRQLDLDLIYNNFNNIGDPNADNTPFGLSSNSKWGRYISRDTDIQMVNSYILTKIYTDIGFNNSFILENYSYKPKFIRINDIEKLNITYPLGPSFSNLLNNRLIKGVKKEDVFSGYIQKRKINGCGI